MRTFAHAPLVYRRYVVDLCVQHLSSTSPDSTTARPKKKRKQPLQGVGEGELGSDTAAEVDLWVLKGRVLRALHRCFLYDSVGFVDQDKVRVSH